MPQLVDALEWCLDLGINYVTVYAFSVDNFRRPESEVGDLMSLASDKLEELMQV
jgi:ditrans,polycis-polyprenyl diphosphate synthase